MLAVLGEDRRQESGGGDGQLHGCREELLLAVEVVVYQRRIDAGAGGDVADGGVVVAAVAEGRPGGGEDRGSRTAAGPTPTVDGPTTGVGCEPPACSPSTAR